jgi:hypothetical protein
MAKCTFDGCCRWADATKECTFGSWCRFKSGQKSAAASRIGGDARVFLETLKALLDEAPGISLALADLDNARYLAAELHERLVNKGAAAGR